MTSCVSICRRKRVGRSSAGAKPFEWPEDDKGQSTRPKDIGEHLTKAVRASCGRTPGSRA